MPATNRIIDIKRVETGSEPITLQQVKDHLIITSTDDDSLLTRLLTQCRKAIEEYCAVSIVYKTITLTAYINKDFELPYGPTVGIADVSTRNGTEGSGPTTYTTAENWQTEGDEFLTLVTGWGAFPGAFSLTHRFCNPVYRIVYTVGYGANTPEDLKLAILNEIAYRYENRGNESISGICEAAQALAFPYKRLLWF